MQFRGILLQFAGLMLLALSRDHALAQPSDQDFERAFMEKQRAMNEAYSRLSSGGDIAAYDSAIESAERQFEQARALSREQYSSYLKTTLVPEFQKGMLESLLTWAREKAPEINVHEHVPESLRHLLPESENNRDLVHREILDRASKPDSLTERGPASVSSGTGGYLSDGPQSIDVDTPQYRRSHENIESLDGSNVPRVVEYQRSKDPPRSEKWNLDGARR